MERDTEELQREFPFEQEEGSSIITVAIELQEH